MPEVVRSCPKTDMILKIFIVDFKCFSLFLLFLHTAVTNSFKSFQNSCPLIWASWPFSDLDSSENGTATENVSMIVQQCRFHFLPVIPDSQFDKNTKQMNAASLLSYHQRVYIIPRGCRGWGGGVRDKLLNKQKRKQINFFAVFLKRIKFPLEMAC